MYPLFVIYLMIDYHHDSKYFLSSIFNIIEIKSAIMDIIELYYNSIIVILFKEG